MGKAVSHCCPEAAVFPGEPVIHAEEVAGFGARLGLAWGSRRADTERCAQMCRRKGFPLQPLSADSGVLAEPPLPSTRESSSVPAKEQKTEQTCLL